MKVVFLYLNKITVLLSGKLFKNRFPGPISKLESEGYS